MFYRSGGGVGLELSLQWRCHSNFPFCAALLMLQIFKHYEENLELKIKKQALFLIIYINIQMYTIDLIMMAAKEVRVFYLCQKKLKLKTN